jgi:hypothetical protein
MATLKTVCKRFGKAGGADSATRARQNNKMVSMCLANSLSLTAKVQLLTYKNEYIFDGVEYAPLMYKVIMHLATIDSVATTQTLWDNLQNLSVFAAMVSGDIDKINTEFNKNYSQILAQGATVDDPLNLLFNAYLVVPCYHFKTYMKQKHNSYLDGTLTLTHKVLMAFVKAHFDYLKIQVSGVPNLPTTKRSWPWRPKSRLSRASLSLTLSLAPSPKTRKRTIRVRTRARRRTKRTLPTRNIRKRMKHGRKCLPRMVTQKKSNWANIPFNGANTTWRGPPTSLRIAA